MGRPSDNMQPAGKRRPGEQLTKDNYDESDEEGQGVDPGTWGKADAATMARRKVIKVRRGAAPPPEQPAEAAAAAAGVSNPFAGVSMTAATAPTDKPFAGISLAAAAAAQSEKQAEAAPASGDEAAAKPSEAAAAASTDNKPSEAAQATAADDKASAEETAPAAAAAAGEDTGDKQPGQQQQPEQQDASAKPDEAKSEQKADDKPAAAAAAGPGSAGLFGSSGTGGFGGFAGFGGLASGSTGFGGGGFGGFAAAAKDAPSGGSLFGSYTAPQPGSLFGSAPAFGGAGAGSKAKDVEEGGGGEGGEEGGEENGQEVFGGPEVAPVVQLSEVPKQTGEEDENSVFTADGKLYEFVNGKDWRERGRGDLRLNIHRGTHRARLVMRQKGSQRLLLNANLYPKMNTSKMVGGKGATFSAVNAAPPVPGEEQPSKGDDKQEGGQAVPEAGGAASTSMKTYAFKSSADEINAFLAAVEKYKGAKVDDDAAGDTPAADTAGKPAPSNPDGW